MHVRSPLNPERCQYCGELLGRDIPTCERDTGWIVSQVRAKLRGKTYLSRAVFKAGEVAGLDHAIGLVETNPDQRGIPEREVIEIAGKSPFKEFGIFSSGELPAGKAFNRMILTHQVYGSTAANGNTITVELTHDFDS